MTAVRTSLTYTNAVPYYQVIMAACFVLMLEILPDFCGTGFSTCHRITVAYWRSIGALSFLLIVALGTLAALSFCARLLLGPNTQSFSTFSLALISLLTQELGHGTENNALMSDDNAVAVAFVHTSTYGLSLAMMTSVCACVVYNYFSR